MTDNAIPSIARSLSPNVDLGTAQPSVSNARLFVVYNGYRFLLAAGLLMLMIIPATANLMRSLDQQLFSLGILILLLSAIGLTGSLGQRLHQSETACFGLMLVDILTITLFASASGGFLGGFSVLYLITVAAAAVFFQTRILATLVAAIAVLALLTDALWLVTRGAADIGTMLPAGILGSLFFVVSLLVQLMTKRLAAAEAERQSAEMQVAALQQLNQQIVLRMETGIVLAGQDGACTPINAAAQKLLNLSERRQTTLAIIAPELDQQYRAWLTDSRQRPKPFRVEADGPALMANFVALNPRADVENLIFIEDYTPITQFAQSLKLNSLSKLTASIAHEIRNPLAAISHAAQLMSESQTIDPNDAVLCEILVNNSIRVSDIIDNVMEVSRREPPRQEHIDLSLWLRSFCHSYREQHPQPYQLTIVPSEASAKVLFDPRHLERVMTNLIDNGLRHALNDVGEAVVRLVLEQDAAGGQMHIDVIDAGHGVPESSLTRLFEPFFTTSQSGSGLGLYLCKELCELNGAELIYRRSSAGESTFRVSMRWEQD